jgi:dipeptidyl aminopeptidase/acylaminoacyl peptidase
MDAPGDVTFLRSAADPTSVCLVISYYRRMSNASVVWAMAVCVLTGRCAIAETAAPVSPVSPVVRSYARAPLFAAASLSPDGNFLSYIGQSSGSQFVVVRRLGDGREEKTLEVDPARERVRWCDWAGGAQLLCGTVLPVRAPDRITERTRLYGIDAGSGRVRELNARLTHPLHDQVIDFLPQRSGQVLLQQDTTGRGFPEVAELDVASGAVRRVVSDRPPITRWLSDGKGNVRLGIAYENGVGSLFVRSDEGDWRLLLQQSMTDVDAIAPLAFGATAHDLYVLKHHGGRTALFHVDIAKGATAKLLFADPRYDVAGPVILDPVSRALLAVRYVAQDETQNFFDVAEAERQAWLDRQLPDTINTAIGRTRDGGKQLIRAASDVRPPSLYLFDVVPRRLTPIGSQYPELQDATLARMHPIVYRARDGQAIPSYLTSPPGAEKARGPAIVLPHGGPEARNSHGFDPLAQFLAAQGYVVLQMNFRGSLGYGAGFAAAGAGQWGGVIHNDVTDGARWLVEQGWADPARICIVGASFGGFAALLGAARESQWYACAASYAGVGDLLALSQYTERLPEADIWRQRLGENSRALWQMSPIARIHTVETPVFLMHGRHDPVVPVTQSRRFARALRSAGKQHVFIERPDCDHDMTIESCRIAFYAELQKFIAAALGPSPP